MECSGWEYWLCGGVWESKGSRGLGFVEGLGGVGSETLRSVWCGNLGVWWCRGCDYWFFLCTEGLAMIF